MEPIILGNYESTTRYSYKPDIAYKKTIGGRRPDAGGMENADYWIDSAGDGGIAGKGGNITVASSAKIYAFNGNMITDENYDNVYEYDKDGNKTTNLLSPITRKDGKIIIPAKIFAQDGILRNVYKLNSWWNNRENYNKEFFEKILGNTLNKEEVEAASMATTKEELNVILIRKEQQCESGGYVNSLNPNLSNQGIGSGAGYIEISNGTFILK